MRTALRVPWDVPVRLVAATGASGTGPASGGATGRTVRTVGVGHDLLGVRAVRVTTVRVDGVEQLERIGPVAPDGAVDRDGDLGELLATLAVDDGAVPVLVAGTAFTHAVLEALARVPCGGRITYAGLAAAAGRPRAIRAVASVMARNRVPLLLPCHRVVPSSGGVGRYGWGDAVKVALLDAEADVAMRAEAAR